MKLLRHTQFVLYLVYLNSVTRVTNKSCVFYDDRAHTVLYCSQDLLWDAANYERLTVVEACLDWVSPHFSKNRLTPLDLVIYSEDCEDTGHQKSHRCILKLLEAGADSSTLGDQAISVLVHRHPFKTIIRVAADLTERQLRVALAHIESHRTDVIKYLLGRLSNI